jgi:hypothetical protein
MKSWSEGYETDVDYTFGHYRELHPSNVKFALALAGYKSPKFKAICELGFGQGLTLNFTSATTDAEVYGTDFNASHASFALDLNEAFGGPAHIYDESFSEFCNRTDLPKFDFIGLHGIWSWVSEENRQLIVNFLRTKLAPGGIVYFGYNTLAGWASMMPLRDYMSNYIFQQGSRTNSKGDVIAQAVSQLEQLGETDPLFLKLHPELQGAVAQLKEKPPQYLAHEYFNKDWRPMGFGEMTAWLGESKLTYGCSADLMDQLPNVNFTDAQIKFLNSVSDTSQREMTKDLILNQRFRKEYWVKGARRLSNSERKELLSTVMINLSTVSKFDYSVTRHNRKISLDEKIYSALLDRLSDYQSWTILELSEAIPSNAGNKFDLAFEAVCVLHSCGLISVNFEILNPEAEERARLLNKKLINRLRADADMKHICSPLASGGIIMDWLDQLFTLALIENKSSADELAEAAWARMKQENRKLQKDGQIINEDAQNVAELRNRAVKFLDAKFDFLKANHIF